MSAVLLIVLVGVAVVATVRSIRRGWSDRYTVEEHHRTLDTLAEIAQRQEAEGRIAERPPRIEPTTTPPHIRIMPAHGSPSSETDQPVGWSLKEPPAAGPPTSPPSAAPSFGGDPAPESEPLATPPAASSPAVPPPTPAPPVTTEPAPPIEPVPPVAPVGPVAPVQTPVPEVGPVPVSSLQSDIPPLSAPITPPLPTPSRPAPVPPEPAAPLVALTMSGGEAMPQPPAPSHRWRKRLIAGVSAAATLLVAVGVITTLARGSGSGRVHPRVPAAASPVSPPPVTTPPTTAAPVASASAVLIESNSQGARYSVEPSPASIELVPTSPCWVQVRTHSASGPVIFQGTMHVGDHLPLPTSAPVWLRLGNPPGISIVVNGTPLHLVTSSVAQPYNLELQPAT